MLKNTQLAQEQHYLHNKAGKVVSKQGQLHPRFYLTGCKCKMTPFDYTYKLPLSQPKHQPLHKPNIQKRNLQVMLSYLLE